MVAGDFTGDGEIDLAVMNNDSGVITMLMGNGDGTFQSPGSSSTGLAGYAWTIPSRPWRAISTAMAGSTWPSRGSWSEQCLDPDG